MKFAGKVFINGKLEAKTGLHIGGSKEVIEIGGLDLPVIKDPFGIPYIPGSSLRGKMRALLELKDGRGAFTIKAGKKEDKFTDIESFFRKYMELREVEGKVDIKGKPCSCGECEICKLFGIPANESKGRVNLTRLVIRDAFLNEEEWRKKFGEAELLGGEEYTEVKYENSIDRLTSVANPRQVERVPAGAVFDFSMSVKILEESDVELLKTLFTGMRLLEDDYLGGHGSRGYGAVEFKDIKISVRSSDYYTGEADEVVVAEAENTSKIYDKEVIERIRESLKVGK